MNGEHVMLIAVDTPRGNGIWVLATSHLEPALMLAKGYMIPKLTMAEYRAGLEGIHNVLGDA